MRSDGRASVEHQLSIHVNDLVEAFQHHAMRTDDDVTAQPDTGKAAAEISTEEVLMGVRYCMDYRIKGGKMPNMDADMMRKLADGLLLVMKQKEKGVLWKRTTDDANAAFALFGEFIEEGTIYLLFIYYLFIYFTTVEEFRRAVTEMPAADLAYALKIHLRVQQTDQKEAALAMLSLFKAYFPSQFSWQELVKKKHQDDIEQVLKVSGVLDDSSRKRMPTTAKPLLYPPPALYADRRVERILDMYKTSIAHGLKASQVQEHLAYYGFNDLPPPPRPSALKMIWVQLTDFMVIILILATVLSIVLHHYDSAIVLAIVVLLNVLIGFTQEFKASRALEALLSLSVPKATVIRDGQKSTLGSRELVPGDMVVLEEGDAVPADLRLVEVAQLEVIESVLTGESVAVAKNTAVIQTRSRKLPLGDCHGNAFMSTVVARGRAKGVVVRTGPQTEIGKISSAILNTKDVQTPMQIRLARLGIILVILSVALCALVVIIGLARQRNLMDIVTLGVTLAVSVIPEGLVAVVTVTMAIGVRRMAQRSAIIRKLAGVESLGSVTVICSDKTGTLTEGKMSATKLWTADDQSYTLTALSQDMVAGAVQAKGTDVGPADMPLGLTMAMMSCSLCNNSAVTQEEGKWNAIGDPTELALLIAGIKSKLDKKFFESVGYTKMGEYAFDSDRKLMSVLYHRAHNAQHQESKPDLPDRANTVILAKGAPEGLLARCTQRIGTGQEVIALDNEYMDLVSRQSSSMASLGLRVLGLACRFLSSKQEAEAIIEKKDSKESEKDLVFVGLIGLIDPPREGVKESVSLCKKAGIDVIMITGDHVVTAMAIATSLGILNPENPAENRAMKGVELDLLTEEGLQTLHPFPTVFARVSPDNKLKIVQALQARGHSVAMTGDGVNDAPAIKAANVGVAMGISGTEITKQAADVVLANDDFSTIVAAVEEGRRVFDNIQKFVFYLLSCNFAEIFVMLLAVAIGADPPFTAMMILYANIIADVPPSTSIGLEPAEIDVMQRAPRDPKHGVIPPMGMLLITMQAFIMGSIALAAYFWQLAVDGYPLTSPASTPDRHAQTLTFMLLTTMQLFQSFLSRSVETSVFRTGFFGNLYMVAAFIFSFCFMLMAIYIPGFAVLLDLEALTQWQDWVKILGAVLIQLALSELMKFGIRSYNHKHRARLLPVSSQESLVNAN